MSDEQPVAWIGRNDAPNIGEPVANAPITSSWTPARIGLVTVGVVVAIAAVIYLVGVSRARSPMLSDVKREWQQDRVILERILADEDSPT